MYRLCRTWQSNIFASIGFCRSWNSSKYPLCRMSTTSSNFPTFHMIGWFFIHRGLGANNIPQYNFNVLDHLLDHLDKVRLLPIIEFMGNIFPRQKRHDTRYMWEDFTYQLVSRYLTRFAWNYSNVVELLFLCVE